MTEERVCKKCGRKMVTYDYGILINFVCEECGHYEERIPSLEECHVGGLL